MNNDEMADGDMKQPPGWLSDALGAAGGLLHFSFPDEPDSNDSFIRRCREAAEVALGVAKMRKEQQRIGFVPLSFADYVQGLVKVSGVSLQKVLARYGIKDLSATDEDSAPLLARLAREVGMGVRETLAHINISLAAQLNAAPMPLLVARYRGVAARQTPVEVCEAVLRQLASDYDLPSLREVRRIEDSIRAVFSGEQESPTA
jgi:hypothetical protein